MKNVHFLRYAFCFYFMLAGLKVFSQDIIIFKSGDEVEAKVLEISTDIVKYKKWNNQNGPTYSSGKVEIFMIKYQNGTKDIFNDFQVKPNPPKKGDSDKASVIEIAKTYMSEQIFSESEGACKLVEFNKQTGVEREMLGQKIYTLEYRLIIKER